MPEAETRQRHLLVGEQRRHEARPGLVGMLSDPSHQRHRDRRRRQQQILSGSQLQPHLDRYLGEAVEFDGIDRRRGIALVCGHGIPACVVRGYAIIPAFIAPSLSSAAHSRDRFYQAPAAN